MNLTQLRRNDSKGQCSPRAARSALLINPDRPTLFATIWAVVPTRKNLWQKCANFHDCSTDGGKDFDVNFAKPMIGGRREFLENQGAILKHGAD